MISGGGVQAESRTLLDMPLTDVTTLHIEGAVGMEGGLVILQQHRHHGGE